MIKIEQNRLAAAAKRAAIEQQRQSKGDPAANGPVSPSMAKKNGPFGKTTTVTSL